MNKFILPIILVFASLGVIQAQNVGIGTTTPTQKIHVVGNARITALGGAGNALVLTDNNGVLSRTALSGNTTDVLDGTGTFVPIASLTDAWLLTGNAGTTPGTNFIGTTDAQDLQLRTNGVLRLTIESAGELRMANSVNTYLRSGANGGARILGEQGNTPARPAIGFFNTNGVDDGGGGNGIYRPAANHMAFATLSAERMRIVAGGNVGIGTATPGAKLDINGTIAIRGGVPGAGKVLTSNATGLATWQTPTVGDITGVTAGAGITGGGTAGTVTLTAAANNGLYVNAGADRIRMGGPLVENTTITEGAFSLTHNLTGTGDFRVQDLGVNHFEVRDNGLTYFGDDTYWRDGSTAGTNIARLYDNGNDGVFQIYQDGVVQHTIHGIGTTVFNERGLNYDTRIESDLDANMLFVDASTNRVGIGTAAPTAELTVDGWIGRTAHNNGALAGSYNSVGANSAQSNPIYVIGTAYKPAAATLGNMYGVGYTHTNASFINGGGSWGMYVAADGDARIWLGASGGGESYFNTGGFFGLNTNAPTRALDVNGTVRIRGGFPTAGDYLICNDANGNASWAAAGYGMVPIGTIVGWHGNMAGVPGLPAGWYQCNGQAVVDAASPMNGQVVPNLNNATTSNSGDVSRGRFLRGSTTSGLYEVDQANNLDWVNHDDSGNGDTNDYLADEGGVVTIRNYSTSGDRFQLNVDGYETRPTNMTVRWIIRIK